MDSHWFINSLMWIDTHIHHRDNSDRVVEQGVLNEEEVIDASIHHHDNSDRVVE